jgi:histidinol-phosphate/aromatic aminotransferase/cobyric acid decarboxylase-like protein
MPMRDKPATTSRAHGGLNAREIGELGLDPDQIIDFSVNTNPFGSSPALLEAIRTARIDRYPDSSSLEIRRAVAELHGVTPEQVVVGNGASDLLWSVARTLFSPGETAVVAEPAFSEFRAALDSVGVRCAEIRADEQAQFAICIAEISNAIRRGNARGAYLCSPATPAGAAVPATELAEFALEHHDTHIVLDQSFLLLSERCGDLNISLPPNVLRIRSLTKDHAIPGLRVGYLLCEASIAARIEAARPAWSVNAIAQAAARVALREGEFIASSWEKLRTQRNRLIAAMRALGLNPIPSSTFFFVVRVGDAANLRLRLLREHLLVRDCASFGLPGYIRIAARPAADCDKLMDALKRALPAVLR